MDKLSDKFGREINYLRISVTDRCNLRCVYCMPPNGIFHKQQDEILSFEEIYRIARVAAALGISKVRITGGEPLVRKDLTSLIEKLKNIHGLNEIALTTNGINLSDHASSLKKAGLDRVNISLDSLLPEKFKKITRGGELGAVLDGIESSLSVGFSPLKINVVLIKGFNACEVLDFANLAKSKPIHVRFIEYMPTGIDYFSKNDFYFSTAEAKDICSSLGVLEPVHNGNSSTARVYRINDFCGTIGFISPISQPFCHSCNKLRLTSDGHLRSCLASSKSVDLKLAMDRGASDETLAMLIRKAVELKPASHNLLARPLGYEGYENFSMCRIGG